MKSSTGSPILSLLLPCSSLLILPAQVLANTARAPEKLSAQQMGNSTSGMTELHDIYGPIPLPETVINYLLAGGAFLVAVFIIVAGLVWIRSHKRAKDKTDDPADRALAEIAQAEASLAENGSRSFLERISTILRRYLEERYQLAVSSRTTAEFFGSITQSGNHCLFPEHADKLKQWLMLCDLAKFASYVPGREKSAELGSAARDFIVSTRNPSVDERT